MNPEDCPNRVNPNHQIGPKGYLARAEWSDAMKETHYQKLCPTCKHYVIWEMKQQ